MMTVLVGLIGLPVLVGIKEDAKRVARDRAIGSVPRAGNRVVEVAQCVHVPASVSLRCGGRGALRGRSPRSSPAARRRAGARSTGPWTEASGIGPGVANHGPPTRDLSQELGRHGERAHHRRVADRRVRLLAAGADPERTGRGGVTHPTVSTPSGRVPACQAGAMAPRQAGT